MRTGFRIRNTVLHIERIVKIEPFGKLFFPKYQNLRQRCPRFGRTGAYGISGFTGSSTEKTSDHFGGLPGAEGIASRYTRYRDSERSWWFRRARLTTRIRKGNPAILKRWLHNVRIESRAYCTLPLRSLRRAPPDSFAGRINRMMRSTASPRSALRISFQSAALRCRGSSAGRGDPLVITA